MDNHQKSINQFTSEDKFFSAIGRFIFEFSQLEYCIRMFIAEKVGLRDEFFDTIMSHDFSVLCNITERLLPGALAPDATSEGPDPLVQGGPAPVLQEKLRRRVNKRELKEHEVKQMIKDCRSLSSRRNRIVHGLWYIAGKEGASKMFGF